ncbi:MAG TPA: FAD-binding oxidoreductase [Mycobacteriales bacterium]|nr:FAD-binding oxidoreductase [Mycobacteriales bacterium]
MTTYPVWGWGVGGTRPTTAELEALGPVLAHTTGLPVQVPEQPAPLPQLSSSLHRATLPPSLRALASEEPADRARHSFGRSYCDVVRGIRGQLDSVPDLVLRPAGEAEVAAVLDWAGDAGVAVVPFGGGTSVVGGVEPVGLDSAVSLDLCRVSGLLDIDPVSRAVRLGAGTLGPAAEDLLRPHGLTLRFYPQSFERSTVGGWLATRAAGHFSTGTTHIDDQVEQIRAVTPTGIWESRRLPASGAGPSPDRLLLGSEGILGVIVDAWLRAQPRPSVRWAATLAATDLRTGTAALRALVQAGLTPATCRLVDATEAALTGAHAGGEAVLVLGFEALQGSLEEVTGLALEVCRDAGLQLLEAGPRGPAGSAWRSTFVQAPYLREQMILLGLLVETFETATTWDKLDGLIDAVVTTTTRSVREVCGEGVVTCRITHVYPDGAAPYFTVLAPARRGSEVAQWREVKAAASEALLAAGGTITHHHAVGRDHQQSYERQRPEPFARALRAAKDALDPRGILNPGALLPAR